MAEKKVDELSVDICVIGGAGAGLCAAVRAVESGVKKVVVLDKMKSMGGCTRGAVGVFSVESPAQKRLGLDYKIDDCYKYHMDMTNWYPDAKLVRNWMCGTGEAIGWLEEHGCYFEDVINFVETGKRYYHRIKGGWTGYTIVKNLLQACQKKGVELRTQTRGTKLLTNAEGAVVGVLATHGDEELRISAKCVIIATGSISSNKALLARFYPGEDLSNVKIMANVAHNTGDGLLMAEEIGAASTHISTLFIGPHNHPYNERTGVIIRRPNLIQVNRNGERFGDESIYADREWSWMFSMATHRQPEKVAYTLLDESILRFYQKEKKIYAATDAMGAMKSLSRSRAESGDEKGEPKDTQSLSEAELTAWWDTVDEDIHEEEEAGRLKIADTLDEIAQWIGCNPETLKTTVAEYNTYCQNKYDADFLKDPKHLLPLTTPPYYAMRAYSGIDTCVGGLRTNHRLEVLNKDLYPIKGLYAAGVVVGNWCGLGYSFMGSEMSFTTYSGYAAGKNAAEFVLNKA